MRDPARIERMLDKLAYLWVNEYPDLRLGQLLILIRQNWEGEHHQYLPDWFSTEDSRWEEMIEEATETR